MEYKETRMAGGRLPSNALEALHHKTGGTSAFCSFYGSLLWEPFCIKDGIQEQ
jgi:hypothetical protein